MVNAPSSISFLLNENIVQVQDTPARLALDWLRRNRHLTGTKEGCKEGDCGSCTVIVGSLQEDGSVFYQPMTSCLLPLADLNGKHLVTIEGLNLEDLSPMQKAMVEFGGTQCGYCTPGFIVSLTAGLLDPSMTWDRLGIQRIISGNLCRCTGYHSILRAGEQTARKLDSVLSSENRLEALCQHGVIPSYFQDVPEILKKLSGEASSPSPKSTARGSITCLAGGTDLYVQRGAELPGEAVQFLNAETPPEPPRRQEGSIILDARTTFETLVRDPRIRTVLPHIGHYMDLISSWPVRTRSTLGGNICNASPIADLSLLFLALDSILVISRGASVRELPLKQFFQGYKTLNKEPDEIVETIRFPEPGSDTFIHWEKVSKRAWLDIASVNAAGSLKVNGTQIVQAHFAMGGVAPIPLYLHQTNAFLSGRILNMDTIEEAWEVAATEIAPLSDVRGSREYKATLARHLFFAHFQEWFPEIFGEEVLHAAL